MHVSPKATNTELCITPTGGTQNPAINNPVPITHNKADAINYKFNLVFLLINEIMLYRLYFK